MVFPERKRKKTIMDRRYLAAAYDMMGFLRAMLFRICNGIFPFDRLDQIEGCACLEN
jgi:hypothetical protein